MKPLRKGERVKLSEEARVANVRQKSRHRETGTFVGLSRSGSPKVIWDGQATVNKYHPIFIVRVRDNQ